MSIDIGEQQYVLPFRTEEAQAVRTYTIGYEGFDILGFVHFLRVNRIERVIDVRRNPISRKKGFSKKAFAETLAKYQIEYVHIPQLGIPSSYRTELNCQADYDALFEIYENELLPKVMEYVEEAAKLIQEKRSVLVCFEKSPKQCHRTRIARKIKEMFGFPITSLIK